MKLILLFGALLLSTLAHAEDAVIARLFAESGVDGTMIIASPKGEPRFVHNDSRATQRFSPASTFKILNTLIGLEEGAVAGKEEIFKWNGAHYDNLRSNKDQTLETAFRVSCVWCYQEIARRVGAKRYRHYISITHFGELAPDFDVSSFWLDGSLRVTAEEQVTFLRALYLRQLPFSSRSYDVLKDVMLAEETSAYRLYAKTGWTGGRRPQVGWYVGYIEKPDGAWIFAMNMEPASEADLPKRQELTKAALKAKGIIP